MKRRISAAVPVLLVFAGCLGGQQATIREEKQVIKTYPFSGPDPSPTQSGGGGIGQRIYPYFSFDELSSTGAGQTWNVVRMENPYIEAFVLPAEGGKLIGAVEKGTGKAFIYYNHVLKFRNISMRGPWTSGGIEAELRDHGSRPIDGEPGGLPHPQEPGRKRELLRGQHGSAVPHRVESPVHDTAGQGLCGGPLALVQPAAAKPVLLCVDEYRREDR